MEKAEIVILKLAQNDSFSDEIAALKKVLPRTMAIQERRLEVKRKKSKRLVHCFDWTRSSIETDCYVSEAD
jgi:hypothetical protein